MKDQECVRQGRSVVPCGSENIHEKDSLGFSASLGSVHRIAEEVGSPRGMVGCVREGQRQSVNAVVDRLVKGGVPSLDFILWRYIQTSCGGSVAGYRRFRVERAVDF